MSASVFIMASPWPYVLFGFVIGSIPFGVIVSRVFFRRDLRDTGSGNIGAANALRTLGPGAGVAVLSLDALKGALPVIAARLHVFYRAPPELHRFIGDAHVTIVTSVAAPLAALAAIVGHCYSPWLRFHGGKGVATFLGIAFALWWPSGAIFVAVWIAIVALCGFSSLGSMLATIAAAGAMVIAPPYAGWNVAEPVSLMVLLVLWRHRENVSRLMRGTENRLPLFRRSLFKR